MIKAYNDLIKLRSKMDTDVEAAKADLDSLIKEIETSKYIVVDIPFNDTSFLNVYEEDCEAVIFNGIESTIYATTDCQEPKLLRLTK